MSDLPVTVKLWWDRKPGYIPHLYLGRIPVAYISRLYKKHHDVAGYAVYLTYKHYSQWHDEYGEGLFPSKELARAAAERLVLEDLQNVK